MPHFAIEMCRQRLAPAHFNRAVIFSEMYSPTDAVPAGFLDKVVPAADLQNEAQKLAADHDQAEHGRRSLRPSCGSAIKR